MPLDCKSSTAAGYIGEFLLAAAGWKYSSRPRLMINTPYSPSFNKLSYKLTQNMFTPNNSRSDLSLSPETSDYSK